MKRVLSFLATLVLLCFSTGNAMSAQVGTVTVNGAVPISCNVTVTPTANASNIADISLGDTDRTIATVNENCNDPSGYTVGVVGTHSGNHTGKFVDSVSAASHPFTITYSGVAVPSGGVVTNVNVPGINLDKTVKISYNSDPGLTATTGFTYAETLTFTIAAK